MFRIIFCCALSVCLVQALPSLLDGDHSHEPHNHTHEPHNHAHEHHAHEHHDHHEPADSKANQQAQPQPDESAKARASEVNDGGRLLTLPDAPACVNRPKHWQLNGKWYFLTTNTIEYKDNKTDWLDGRNLCRKHCMDLVSLETQAEHNMIVDVIDKENLPYIWTSGRLCNFKGCDRPDLLPLLVNGWFWPASGVKIAPTNVAPPSWTAQPWSSSGHFKRPQPDNAEFGINETTEACLAILNNVYKDGIHWHDIACYHTKPIICEDNEELLKYVAAIHPNLKL